jgi:hypothetical protein
MESILGSIIKIPIEMHLMNIKIYLISVFLDS